MVERGGDARTAGEPVGDVGGMLCGGYRNQVRLLGLREMRGDVQYAVPGVAGIEQHSDVA